jgi:hypothetical protein
MADLGDTHMGDTDMGGDQPSVGSYSPTNVGRPPFAAETLPNPRSYPENPEDSRDIVETLTGHSLEDVTQGFHQRVFIPLEVFRDLAQNFVGESEGVQRARESYIRSFRRDPWSDCSEQYTW